MQTNPEQELINLYLHLSNGFWITKTQKAIANKLMKQLPGYRAKEFRKEFEQFKHWNNTDDRRIIECQ